ncbi:hypothetical protein [uncultured Hymenobacter sp.]|uniref:hypothetical protein n=1 Tax=uncultured Hymenobacter sp. TaxID=170016 RepID=UPI0035CBB89C
MEPEYLKLLRLFEEEGVEYLIIGGFAVIAHGYPRFTNDLDLLIRATLENGQRAVRALERFGYAAGEFEPQDFTQIPAFMSFAAGNGWLDLMTAVPGIDFAASAATGTVMTMEGVPLKFVDLASLRRNKQATGRLKDLLDLENLPPA